MDINERKEGFKKGLKDLLEQYNVHILLEDTAKVGSYYDDYKICFDYPHDGEDYGDEIMGTYITKDTL